MQTAPYPDHSFFQRNQEPDLKKPTIAFLQNGIYESAQASGASRFNFDFFKKYNLDSTRPFRLIFLTDRISVDRLRKDHLLSGKKNIVRTLATTKNRFNNILEQTDLLLKIMLFRIKVLHLGQYYHISHYKLLKFVQRLPKRIRPKLCLTWVHCNFPHEYSNPEHPCFKDFHDRFDGLFHSIKLTGIFSYYELVKSFIEENKLFHFPTRIQAIRHYCCDSERFSPSIEKQNIIVWAARLDSQKRPMLFLEALRELVLHSTSKIQGWKFLLCGQGGLESSLQNFITQHALNGWVEMKSDVSDMASIFSVSKCFVSTQDYENFTSLSMNEAMSAGNAIIARPVGQTNYYLVEGQNGIMMEGHSACALAQAILRYIEMPQAHEAMMQGSLGIIKKVHNFENYRTEIESFWSEALRA